MKYLFHAYRIFNLLSLDVAAGAMVSALFFAKIFQVTIFSHGLIALGLSVWIIYTADHLLDAKKIKQKASTVRHRFHQDHFIPLCISLLIALIADVVQLFSIRQVVFIHGIVLGVMVGVYFIVQRYLGWMKELTGALLYSGGVLLVPLSMDQSNLTWFHYLLIAQFALVALINLLVFSWIDQPHDKRDQHTSFATTMGNDRTHSILVILFFVQLIFFVVQLFFFETTIQLVLLAMNVLLFIIFFYKDYFEKNDRYRLLGDAVFFLPLVYIFW
ncbi:MAG: hypothetical protein OJF59_001373 [Cytophagales bacterium]|nr:hypothetical protein [Bacteroidota bacterium]MBS1982284.1 hypothetical protein [Bacteroidota bacterium]WHZ07620.1 MAG: hypothetical protein OJF59_001373 [Cytophagales bacterium]